MGVSLIRFPVITCCIASVNSKRKGWNFCFVRVLTLGSHPSSVRFSSISPRMPPSERRTITQPPPTPDIRYVRVDTRTLRAYVHARACARARLTAPDLVRRLAAEPAPAAGPRPPDPKDPPPEAPGGEGRALGFATRPS